MSGGERIPSNVAAVLAADRLNELALAGPLVVLRRKGEDIPVNRRFEGIWLFVPAVGVSDSRR